jgi:two-component system, NtrC family, response regulator GlrR
MGDEATRRRSADPLVSHVRALAAGGAQSAESFHGIVGQCPAMRAVFGLIEAVAPTDATVLIQGETGTGKELAARAVHELSHRSDGPFVAINCGGIAPSLIETELFGHAKGAFTGAAAAHPGVFQEARGGTLFLDEVGELGLDMQTRLLRVLQEREIRPVGGTRAIPIDVRVIAATNRELSKLIDGGTFRRDLYYRLRVFSFCLPPLRERIEDVPLLMHHFAHKHSARLKRPPPPLTEAGIETVRQSHWPGNLRELENAVERAVILGIPLDPAAFPRPDPMTQDLPGGDARPWIPLAAARRDFERRYLGKLLEHTSGNRAVAARLAGIDPSNLRRLLRRHDL